MTGKGSQGKTVFLREKIRKGLWIIALLFVPGWVYGETLKKNGFLETIWIIATEQGLSPKLVDSIIRAESNGDPKAVSHKGAMGLMQLMPGTAKEYQVSDPFDPVANIRGGSRYLKDLLDEFSGNLSLALAAYNAGPGAVKKYQGVPPFPETQEFVRKVKDRYLSGAPISVNPVFAAKLQEDSPLDKGSGKVVISGSPREVAAFLKFMKKDK